MKTRPSKLDAHAEQLREWDAASLPIISEGDCMVKRLAARGCSVSPSRVSCFLEAQRSRSAQDRLLAQITSGSRACQEVEAQFSKTEAPALESLIKLHRVVIMQLATQAGTQPELLELMGGAMKPVLEFAKLELKGREFSQSQEHFKQTLAQKEKELALAREKFETEKLELILKAAQDARVQAIAASDCSNADKIAQLRQTYFADVDALEKSGSVQLPA